MLISFTLIFTVFFTGLRREFIFEYLLFQGFHLEILSVFINWIQRGDMRFLYYFWSLFEICAWGLSFSSIFVSHLFVSESINKLEIVINWGAYILSLQTGLERIVRMSTLKFGFENRLIGSEKTGRSRMIRI